ncbi:UNVERIFIED_CONTAM: Copia protein [Sesamum latifolium]|uniref:Copia protein n=1 Tax=Sesamum latifolium TaxID=2727402 RepID=A0AAW2U4T8_9LAMI
MSDIDSDKWLEAIKSKIDSMGSNQVWTLVDPPKGVRPVGCKWVYKCKLGADGEVTAFKARLVAKGYTQRPEVDFEETYSPVTWYDYEIWQMDVKMTFLNKTVEEEMFMDQSEGLLPLEKNRRSVVSKGLSIVLNKLPESGTHVLMKSYGVMISSRMSMILVYTKRSVGAWLRTLCFMSMTSFSLVMKSRCLAILKHGCLHNFS